AMAALLRLCRRIRGARPKDERAQVDRRAGRPDLWFALAAARTRGSLCVRRLAGEVCDRLRGGVDQGDEPGPLRPRLISAEKFSRLLGQSAATGQCAYQSKCKAVYERRARFELSVPGRETVKPPWETGLLPRKRERICWGTGR